jgi:hypothetical protein
VLDSDVDGLCLDFTDVVHDAPAPHAAAPAAAEPAAAAAAEPAAPPSPPPPAEPPRVELVPGGAQLEVTNQNKAEWVRLVCEWRLFGCVERQCAALLAGVEAAVPRPILRQLAALVGPADLARMLAGEPHIDLADWRANTATTGGLKRDGRVFRWFWRAVRSFTEREAEQLLQFVTGSRRPPVGGFAQLQGFNGGVHRFTMCASAEPKDSLPRAHACICTIDLPEYSSYLALRKALHTAISLGSIGFDDAAVTTNHEAADPPAADAPADATQHDAAVEVD